MPRKCPVPLFTLALMILALLAVACDPLAPEAMPTRIALNPTATATNAPLPTAIPSATSTPTDTPTPTATPTITPVPTATPRVCAETQGRVVSLTFFSEIVRQDVPYDVYLPPCYAETGRRYPYVLLMHGADQDEKIWIEKLGAQKALEAGLRLKALPPMVLVMPYGGELANLNIFREGAGWESVVLTELMPQIEANFCTWNEREGRAIGGISRGGFWAYLIAMRHPELFGTVGGHSPAFYWENNAPPSHNPLYLARDMEFPPGLQPRMWVDIGSDDKGRPTTEEFHEMLEARGIDSSFTLNPVGNHDVDYWAAHISEYLTFYGQVWPRNIQDLPSCLQ